MSNNGLVITNAGLAEIVNAEQNGTAPVVLSEVRFGTGQYTPTADRTALEAAFKTFNTISGGAAGDNILHITVEDDSADAYTVYEVGVFTDSGTLFAVYSQTNPIISKASRSVAILATDILLGEMNPESITIGDINFELNQATTERKGVIELATEAEAKAGTDTHRAVTPAALDKTIEAHDNIVHRSGAETITGTKTFDNIQLTGDAPYIRVGNNDVVKGTTPEAGKYWGISFSDSEGYVSKNRLSLIETSYSKEGNVTLSMGVYKPEHDNSTAMTKLSVVYPATGNPYATAPTPAAGDNSTKIATTTWVTTKVKEYLPLAGGTMTGNITASTVDFITRNQTDSAISIIGGTSSANGAYLRLFGKDNSTNSGEFYLSANDGTNIGGLIGYPDGRLIWEERYVLNNSFNMPNDTGAIILNSATTVEKGAGCRFYSGSHSAGIGRFQIIASDETNGQKVLQGLPNGQLTWNGENLLGITSKTGSGYAKLPSGLIIQWGEASTTLSSETTNTVAFPIEFPNGCHKVIGSTYCSSVSAAADGWVQIKSYDSTSFTWFAQFNGDIASIRCAYIAIGY